MDNLFITHWLDWPTQQGSRGRRVVNALLREARSGVRLVHRLSPSRDMTLVEHRMNLFHLVEQVCAYQVPGDLVELGCFSGDSAVIIQGVHVGHGARKTFHVYDSFETQFTVRGDVREALEHNFERVSLPLPEVHAGRFEQTLPDQLPERIAFCHLDCGFGQAPEAHAALVEWCLAQVYPRLSRGAIVLLMDYHLPAATESIDVNPGVRLGAERFFADKNEKVCGLYAGQGAQGYVRKS